MTTSAAPLHMLDEDVGLSDATLRKALWLLQPRELKAYLALIVELRDAGQLPTGSRSLADRAHVSVASFEKMAEALDRLFSRDAEGRWTDHGVMQARGKRAVLPAQELPPVNPRRSAANRINGGAGGTQKAINDRLRKSQACIEAGADLASEGLANGLDPASETKAGEADLATSSPENPLANGSPGKSLSVCLLESSSEKTEQTDKQASDPHESASDANAGSLAKSLANEGAKSVANGPAESAPPARQAEAAERSASGDGSRDADRAMAKAMVAACTFDGKPNLDGVVARKRLTKIREWIAKGCAFERDYLPELRAFAKGKSELDDPANRYIQDATFARRDYSLDELRQAGLKNGAAVDGQSKVYVDDPTNRAALEALFAKRPYLRESRHPPSKDAGGTFRIFTSEAWLEALASTAVDTLRAAAGDGRPASP